MAKIMASFSLARVQRDGFRKVDSGKWQRAYKARLPLSPCLNLARPRYQSQIVASAPTRAVKTLNEHNDKNHGQQAELKRAASETLGELLTDELNQKVFDLFTD